MLRKSHIAHPKPGDQRAENRFPVPLVGQHLALGVNLSSLVVELLLSGQQLVVGLGVGSDQAFRTLRDFTVQPGHSLVLGGLPPGLRV